MIKAIILFLRGEWVICDFIAYLNTDQGYLIADKSNYIKDMLLRTRFEANDITHVMQMGDFIYEVSTPFENHTLLIVDICKLVDFKSQGVKSVEEFI